MIAEKSILINTETINFLAKNYNTLDYYVKLSTLLKNVYPLYNFENYSKYELHKLLNDTLIQHYNGEEIHKYKLFEQNLKKRNIIGAFEMKVNNSRVDFLTINGYTTSYEIKSELDNLTKLSKQMADYILAFEYNYLVIDERHLEKANNLLPEKFGLWSYKNGKYKKLKKAELNDKIDPEMQLKLLTKKELAASFPEQQGIKKKILANNNSQIINTSFKQTIKNRYRDRWNFLILKHKLIFPIDVQFFFNKNIEPSHIYYH